VKLPAYPRTKPSGVEWLGDVPEHWEVKPLKHLTDFINGAPFKPEDWSQDGVPIIRIENLNGGDNFNGYEGSVRERYHVSKGDLLFGWSGNRGTSFGPFLWPREGLHYLNQHIFRLADFSCDRSWFYWALKAVTKTIEDEAHGIIGMVHVTKGKLGAVQIPFLPPAEQRSIGAFLDRETGRVDRLVAKKRELIERLKEKRTALISRTVTRGLPPAAARAAVLPENPPLKPSGIEWLGDIPAHWEVVPLFRVSETIQTGPFGSQLHSADYVEGGIPLINPAHIVASRLVPDELSSVDDSTAIRLSRHRLREGDIIMARRGEIGRCARVGVNEAGWLCGTGSLVIRLRNADSNYFATIISGAGFSGLLELHAVGTTMLNLNPTIVGRMLVPVPPLPEQAAIAAYLDEETAKLDTLVGKVEEAVERLQEYRTALITAAVTGKMDVRGYAGVAVSPTPNDV